MDAETKTNWTPWIIVALLAVALVGWFILKKMPGEVKKEGENEAALITTENEFEEISTADMSLTITSPADGVTSSTSTLTIKGKTLPDAEVFVNDLDARADATGNFSVSYTLDEGENYIIVGANDAEGNVSEQELTVFYEG